MRISDWSSDVCSSDLALAEIEAEPQLDEDQKLITDESGGPSLAVGRGFDRGEHAVQRVIKPWIGLTFRQGRGGEGAGQVDGDGGKRFGENGRADVDTLGAEQGDRRSKRLNSRH